MSGHSKWSTIKRKKAANDAKRGKMFTRLAREITIAAREGGDPDMNMSLRLAVDKAKSANMPKDNIERAIKRGTGELKDAEEIVEVIYEAYGPSGIALLVEVATDNRNRTLAELKHVLSMVGGNMAEPGAVSWQFEQKGYITVPADVADYDELFMVAADAGAEDVVGDDDFYEVFTPREDLHDVLAAIKDAGIKIDEARLDWIAQNTLDIDPESAMRVMSLIEEIEDLDDTQMVYSNLNMTDQIVEAFEAAG
jgi:YebC/PmpR family DNA-binding regulatory protein